MKYFIPLPIFDNFSEAYQQCLIPPKEITFNVLYDYVYITKIDINMDNYEVYENVTLKDIFGENYTENMLNFYEGIVLDGHFEESFMELDKIPKQKEKLMSAYRVKQILKV